ncbi:hypothetical protein J2R80_006558 [Bradyrhizobium sp. USDA 4541]|nr:hypothetical protein [Bradyrhizobium sp. USDA 4541]
MNPPDKFASQPIKAPKLSKRAIAAIQRIKNWEDESERSALQR